MLQTVHPWIFPLLLLVVAIAGCDKSESLPECPRACVQDTEKVASLGRQGEQWRVYPAASNNPVLQTEKPGQALSALDKEQSALSRGLAGAKAVYLRCDKDAPSSAITELVQASAKAPAVLGLGGMRAKKVAFVSLGLWDGKRADKEVGEGLARMLGPGEAVPKVCKRGAKPCPVILLSPGAELSCGALLARVQEVQAQQHLIGLVVNQSK